MLRDEFRLQSSYSIRKTLLTSTPVFFRIMPSLGFGRTTVAVAMALGRVRWTCNLFLPESPNTPIASVHDEVDKMKWLTSNDCTEKTGTEETSGLGSYYVVNRNL